MLQSPPSPIGRFIPAVVIGLLDGTLSSSQDAAGHATDVPTSEAGVDFGPPSRQDAGGITLRRTPVESGGRCPTGFASKPHEFLSEGFSPSSELGASDRALPAFGEHALVLRGAQLCCGTPDAGYRARLQLGFRALARRSARALASWSRRLRRALRLSRKGRRRNWSVRTAHTTAETVPMIARKIGKIGPPEGC